MQSAGFTVPQTARKRNRGLAPLFDTTRTKLKTEEALEKSPLEIISAPVKMVEFTNTTAMEMVTMSALGLGLSVAVIYALASSSSLEGLEGLEGNKELESRALATVYANVVDAALPRDATDVLTVVLGESIGGFIGAASTTVVTALLRVKMKVEQKSMVVEAIADGDYFLAKAAVLPLLTALGVPDLLASIASVLLATIPYELVKLGPKRRQQRQAQDDRVMDKLLLEQQEKKLGLFSRSKPSANEATASVDVDPNEPVEEIVDIPDIVADIIKWLEYDVLKKDFGGRLLDTSGSVMSSGVEGAMFGFLAGLSSQLYLDTVRTYTDYGPEDKRLEARTRNFSGWVSLYSTQCLSTAALFGIYETCKKPISVYVASVLSGGVDGCLGSSNVKACLDAYLSDNPPDATLGAQVRSFATSVVSLTNRLEVDGAYDTQVFVRGAVVQLYNIYYQVVLQVGHIDTISM
jgi:hypothetical protein